MRVVIVGSGVIGAALAFACAQRGAEVTVVDAMGPAAGATGRSFGWINASFFADAAHFALRAEGIEAYRRLCATLDLPIRWTGCLCWEEQGEGLAAQAATLRDLGYAVETVEKAEFEALEPRVKAPEQALKFSVEAAAEPAALTRALLEGSGARCLFGSRVQEVRVSQGRVTGAEVPGGTIEADRVIICGGTSAPALLAPLGLTLPMLSRPGVIFETAPLPQMLNHVCVAPIGEFRQTDSGRIVMPTAVSHQGDSTEQLSATPAALAQAACARLGAFLPGVALRWQHAAVAERPVPQDGLPVIGAGGPEGLFTAVMHSGVTLAAIVAELLSAQVLDQPLTNTQTALMAPYGIGRFQPDAGS